MPSPIRAFSLLAPLALMIPAAPALAKVLAEGPAKGDYYWQKIDTNSGKVRYLCRSTSDSKIQKGAKCTDAHRPAGMVGPAAFALVLLLDGPAGAATVVSVGERGTMRVRDGGAW